VVGVADANAARNNIAKDYMKKCNCIWILAPITRAVDDKTARGNTSLASYPNEGVLMSFGDQTFLGTHSRCN
jgi:hypothetical protein